MYGPACTWQLYHPSTIEIVVYIGYIQGGHMITGKGDYIIEIAPRQEERVMDFLKELGVETPTRIASGVYVITIRNLDAEIIRAFPGVQTLIVNEDIATITY